MNTNFGYLNGLLKNNISSDYSDNISNNYQNLFVASRSAPEFIDMDFDNDYDLVLGSQYEGLSYYKNIGNQNVI